MRTFTAVEGNFYCDAGILGSSILSRQPSEHELGNNIPRKPTISTLIHTARTAVETLPYGPPVKHTRHIRRITLCSRSLTKETIGTLEGYIKFINPGMRSVPGEVDGLHMELYKLLSTFIEDTLQSMKVFATLLSNNLELK
jgi:hypothetical protein